MSLVALAGCRFEIGPDEALTEAERVVLERFCLADDDSGTPFTIELVSALPRPHAYADSSPAVIDVAGHQVSVGHARFFGIVEPTARRGRLDRGDAVDGSALEIFLRVALGCALPLDDGVLLHSAGAVIDGDAVAFCGRSGAGKSTLAGLLPLPVLSDELIAIRRSDSRFVARGTGLWGTLAGADAPRGVYPLRALCDLARGEGVALEPLPRREAMRRLVGVAVVPPHRELWASVLPLLRSLATDPGVHELSWTPREENVEIVVGELRGITSPRS